MTIASGSLRTSIRATIAAVVLLSGPGVACAAPVVGVEGGDVVITDGGHKSVLTHAHADRDPVLSPDGRLVVFTRGATSDDSSTCKPAAAGKQTLMSVDVKGGQPRVLAVAKSGAKPEQQLCNFSDKQFSSDGKHLYFSTPGWATSGALWVVDLPAGKARYLLPSNGFTVLANCSADEYRDKLAVSQHRYFAFGGSFDWYWLYDSRSLKEQGPIGETLDMAKDTCADADGKVTQP